MRFHFCGSTHWATHPSRYDPQKLKFFPTRVSPCFSKNCPPPGMTPVGNFGRLLSPMSILDKIIAKKWQELEAQTREQPLERVQALANSRYQPRGFARTLRDAEAPAIIAEIKRGSPSRGVFRRSLDPVDAALSFAHSGACCLSVLTDLEFFSGSLSFVPLIRDHLNKSNLALPLLRKDFIVDRYQIWQSLALGADALLLILAALSDDSYQSLLAESLDAGLDVLIEVHDEEELTRAITGLRNVYPQKRTNAEALLGINNRCLKSFVTDLGTTERLSALAIHQLQESDISLHRIPLITESGISTREDIDRMLHCAVDGFLVGEALVLEGDLAENLRALRGV